MANTVLSIMCSISVNDGDCDIWQNKLDGGASTDALELTMSSDKRLHNQLSVAADTTTKVYDKDDSHQITTINAAIFISDQDGILILETTDEADSSDVNQIPMKAGVPLILIADAIATQGNGTMKLYGDYTYPNMDAGTLEAVTQIKFYNANQSDAAEVEFIICK